MARRHRRAVPRSAASTTHRHHEEDGALPDVHRFDGAGALLLWVHVQPGARRTEIAGRHGDALKVRVAAPPVDGKANAAVAAVLAEHFGVPVRDVALVAGATARRKRFRLVGVPVDRAEALMAAALTGGNTPRPPDVREARQP